MFGRSRVKLFTAFGIDVEAHWTFLLALAVFAFTGGREGLLIALLVFASVLVHEFGHSLVALRLGVPIAGIELHFFGGVAKMRTLPRTPRDEILIAAAGPLTSLGLAAITGMIWMWTLKDISVLSFLAQINLTLAIFNLLPALPMDGGRIFRAALQTRLGGLRATQIAAKVARFLAVALGLFGLLYNPFLVLLAILLWTMAGQELRVAEIRHGQGTANGIPGFGGQIGTDADQLRRLLEDLARRGQTAQKSQRFVMRDSSGRVVVIEQGGIRW